MVVNSEPGENTRSLLQAQQLVLPKPREAYMRIKYGLESYNNEPEGEQLVALGKPSEHPALDLGEGHRFVSYLSWRTWQTLR